MEIVFNKLISLRLSILVLFILNILGVSLSNAEIYTKKIIASGRAVKINGYEDQTEDMALEAALYQAALQAGSSIEGYSSSSNGLLLDEQTFIRTNARIMDYAILSRKEDGDAVTVTVEAVAAANTMHSVDSGTISEATSGHINEFDRDSIFFFPKKRKPTKASCLNIASINLHLIEPNYNIALNVPDWSLGMPTIIADTFYKYLSRKENIQIANKNFISFSSQGMGNKDYDYSSLAYKSEKLRPNEFYIQISIDMDENRKGRVIKKKNVNIIINVSILNFDKSEVIYQKSVSHKINRGFGIGWTQTDILLRKNIKDSDQDIYRILDWLVSDIRAVVGCLPRVIPIEQSGSFYRANIGFSDGVQKGDLAVINSQSLKGGDITPWIIIVADSVDSNFTSWRLLDPRKQSLVGQKSLAKLIN